MSDRNPLEMPEWLQPYKNEWRSQSRMADVIHLVERPFKSWFLEVKPRLRSVTVQHDRIRTSTQYLVKQVWACAKAHGLTVIPTGYATPIADKLAALEARLEAKTTELHQAIDGTKRLEKELAYKEKLAAVARTTWSTEMRSVMAMCFSTTEARSAPGVYFLLSEDGVVAYVGQSKNVLTRMSGHAEKLFFTVRMIREPDLKKRLELEAELIDLLQPPLNRAGIVKGELA